MTDQPVPGLTVSDPAAFLAWLASTEHLYNCTGYSEGLPCCLERLLPDEGSGVDNEAT